MALGVTLLTGREQGDQEHKVLLIFKILLMSTKGTEELLDNLITENWCRSKFFKFFVVVVLNQVQTSFLI